MAHGQINGSPKPLRRGIRALAPALLVSLATSLPAAAQTGPAPGEPAAKTVEPSSMPLPPDKHALVKEHVTRAKVPEAQVDAPVTVGMIVPDAIELWGLPQDSMTEVPTVSSYKFFHAGRIIAVVDPDSRQVVQLIPS